MVCHSWIADGTQQDAIKASLLKHGQPVLGHHGTFSQITLAAPVKLLHIELEAAMEMGEHIQGENAFRDESMLKMKAIENHFHGRLTHHGLYNTGT